MKKFRISKDRASLISDKFLYNYLLSKSKNQKNISIVNRNKIVYINSISSSLELNEIFTYFSSNFSFKVSELSKIQNQYTDLTKYSGAIFNTNNFIVFKKGVNIISKYTYSNDNYSTIQLDTLPIFKFEYFKNILSPEDFKKCKINYKNSETNNYVRPVSILKINDRLIGINCYLKSFEDGIYNKDSVLFESETSFVIVLDTNLKFQNILKFENKMSKNIIFECGSMCVDSTICYIGSDSDTLNKYFICDFKIINDTLKAIPKTRFDFQKNKKDFMPIISCAQNKVLVVFNQNKRSKICKIKQRVEHGHYEDSYTFKNKFVYGSLLYQTKNNNLIFGIKDDKGLELASYYTGKYPNNTTSSFFYFIYKAKLFKVEYLENTSNNR